MLVENMYTAIYLFRKDFLQNTTVVSESSNQLQKEATLFDEKVSCEIVAKSVENKFKMFILTQEVAMLLNINIALDFQIS